MKIMKRMNRLKYITCYEIYSFGMNCNKQTNIHSKTAVNKSLLLPDCQKSHTIQVDMEKSINVSEG